ncbi:tectonic-3-like isoform X2 [Triplophysa dalaica]|uniref:tectonic-3-like isoform X2 n=1 Tax=Triplophysa dalaica TaxID=1582913 RepID=UPI0024E02782|nr:tectonic-3-like isoform X2 [Triplophysa dalaica]
MTTRVFFCILILYTFTFPQVTYSQSTPNFTTQTSLSTDLSENPFNVTDNPPATTNQSPLAATTSHFWGDSISPVSRARADANATFTDANAAQNTDSITKQTTNPTAVTSESNSWKQFNSSVTSATANPNATFTDVITAESITNPSDCPCDVTPDFCDIGCCCDLMDCGLLNPDSVFIGCQQSTGSGICLESWMMFKANINPMLVTLSGDRFCVQKEDDLENQSDVQTSPAFFQSGYNYPLLLREPTAFNSQKTNFYKVDDIILTYFDSTSIVSTFRQPSPGPASSACINRNPARFLRSSSLSCSRTVTARSCVEDGALSAHTYYTGFSLLRVPVAQVEDRPELLISVFTVRDWPEPRVHNSSCLNVVSEVEYGIEYTGKGEIVKITLDAKTINTSINTQLEQNHAITFKLVTSTPLMATPTPLSGSEGLKPGSPVIGWFGEKAKPLTVLGSSENGGCTARLLNRPPVLFTQNIITGCTFRSFASECGVLRAELIEVLTANAVPELISMTTGDETEKSKVIFEDCPTTASEVCDSGCSLPVALSTRVLWAQRGLKAMPQNHILGAKFIFRCQRLKCPLLSSITVTAEVVFTDTTIYPEAPRGQPKPEWKFPFSFFSRGAGEFDQE